jgi:hypothetical protein
MNRQEVASELIRDYEALHKSTIDRLCDEYIRERKKWKINKEKEYPKVYPIRTKRKNNWLIIVRKPPSDETFNGDVVYSCVVYYYDKKGLCVLRYSDDINLVEVFCGHFFKRYNERMRLDLSGTIDIIKAFFVNNGSMHHRMLLRDGTSLSLCREGFAFGRVHDKGNWLVHKTFITKDMAHYDQILMEMGMTEAYARDLLAAYASKNFNEAVFQQKQNIFLSLLAA